MKKIIFSGQLSGDGECFCWSHVPEADVRAIMGEIDYELELEVTNECLEDVGQPTLTKLEKLYPTDVLKAAGAEHGKKYQFTITAEPIE
jgi:hypothetical protein